MTSRRAEFLYAWAVKPWIISATLDIIPCRISANNETEKKVDNHTNLIFPLNCTKCCSFEETHFLNSWKLKHFAFITFEKFPYFEPKYCCFEANILLRLEKSTIFCGINMKNIPKKVNFSRRMLFWKTQNSLESVSSFLKISLWISNFEFRISNFEFRFLFLGPWDRITFLLKTEAFRFYYIWEIFRILCLNIAALKPTFYCVWKKARYFAESIWKISLKRLIFHGECYFGKHKIVWKAFHLFSKFHFEFRISNFEFRFLFLGPWDRITFLFHVITLYFWKVCIKALTRRRFWK